MQKLTNKEMTLLAKILGVKRELEEARGGKVVYLPIEYKFNYHYQNNTKELKPLEAKQLISKIKRKETLVFKWEVTKKGQKKFTEQFKNEFYPATHILTNRQYEVYIELKKWNDKHTASDRYKKYNGERKYWFINTGYSYSILKKLVQKGFLDTSPPINCYDTRCYSLVENPPSYIIK